MGLFYQIRLWYLVFYLIGVECVRDKITGGNQNGGTENGNGNGTGKDSSGPDIIITMGRADGGNYKIDNGNEFKINDNGDNNNNNDIDDENTKFISRGSVLHNRQLTKGNCGIVVDFEPIGRDLWEKDEYFWNHGGIIGTTLVQRCMFLFIYYILIYFLFFLMFFVFVKNLCVAAFCNPF